MRLIRCLALTSCALLFASPSDGAPATSSLWPDRAPGDPTADRPASEPTRTIEAPVAGRPITIIHQVSQPSITLYRPDPAKDTGAAVLVCPGGGYHVLAIDLEGTEICEWLNSLGVTAVLLEYRVPRRAGRPSYAAPLQDAQRALGLIRNQANALGLDPHRIGVLGFSAGGHLAATVANQHESRTYPQVDSADAVSCRPDFCVLIYPAYLAGEKPGNRLAPELPVANGRTPPTFIVMAEDDPVGVEGALLYYQALHQARVPAEMHLYPRGGHGYGLRRTESQVTAWPELAAAWLRSEGLLTTKP